MKYAVSISLNIVLLLVFTIANTVPSWACGKSNHRSQVQYQQAKCSSNCQKDCCKKSCADSKNKKKKCCGDCSCSNSITVIADLPKQLPLNHFLKKHVFIFKSGFTYVELNSKPTIQDIWQPPITLLSV